MTPLAVLLVALVAEDGTSLRSAPSDTAPAQTTLFRGDWLEVRGQVPGFLKVWDHRHERPGYVRPARVRVHRAEEASADELHAVVRFLRDASGSESLGVGYAALYLRVAAPARRGQPQWAEVLGALGTMADRLAGRGSGARTASMSDARRERDSVLAGHLGVIESYGVVLRRFEQGDHTVLCYDGDAFARVMALAAAAAEERARAALALTRRACFDPASTSATQHRRAWNDARLTVLSEADPSSRAFAQLPRPLGHHLRLRTAEALVERAHGQAASDPGAAARAAGEALRLLALVDRGELASEDLPAYDETAVRVAGVRWLIESPEPGAHPAQRSFTVELAPGQPGESCVRVMPAARAAHSAPLFVRCTYGVVFPASVRFAAAGNAVAVAVAPVAAWTELWLFRAAGGGSNGWRVDVLPPALGQPGDDIGYVELAGFSPDGLRVLVAREFRVGGRIGRRFELLAADGAVLHWAGTPGRLRAFERWASPSWRRTTLSLR